MVHFAKTAGATARRGLAVGGLIAGALVMPLTAARADSPNYHIINYNSSRCMDVMDESTSNGGVIHQWTCHSGLNQKWRFRQDLYTDGYFLIVNANSDKCADVEYMSTANGAKVHQWTCQNGVNQQWSTGPGPTGFPAVGAQYRSQIRNRNSGKCLDVNYSSTGQGALLIQKTCNGSASQLWIVVP